MQDNQDSTTPPPFKKRKFYRKRAEYADEAPSSAKNNEPSSSPPDTNIITLDEMIVRHSQPVVHDSQGQHENPLSVPELLRQRKALQRKRGGIGFANTTTITSTELAAPQDKRPESQGTKTLSKFVTVVDRFAPQTGQVADVDQHMMAYIDSELAKRRQSENKSLCISSTGGHIEPSAMDTIDAVVQRQPAALGKLHEIDLGPDATLTNIARTEAAKRRLDGGNVEAEEEAGKVRLGKDGKPRRNRRRRNSDDMKRDKLVEEVLRESKLDIYDEPDAELANDDQAADDRIAEQFRREFMDAVSQRRQKTTQVTKKPGPGTIDESHKGPKLGGSRSARAAMRELQEKSKKK